jgi:hypothetical protein
MDDFEEITITEDQSAQQDHTTRERSTSVTIIIKPIGGQLAARHPVAFKIIQDAFSDTIDQHLVEFISKRIERNPDGILYPDLRKLRNNIKSLYPLRSEDRSKEELYSYLVQELRDGIEHTKKQKRAERKQKYIIAAIGAVTTLCASTISTLLTYYTM